MGNLLELRGSGAGYPGRTTQAQETLRGGLQVIYACKLFYQNIVFFRSFVTLFSILLKGRGLYFLEIYTTTFFLAAVRYV